MTEGAIEAQWCMCYRSWRASRDSPAMTGLAGEPTLISSFGPSLPVQSSVSRRPVSHLKSRPAACSEEGAEPKHEIDGRFGANLPPQVRGQGQNFLPAPSATPICRNAQPLKNETENKPPNKQPSTLFRKERPCSLPPRSYPVPNRPSLSCRQKHTCPLPQTSAGALTSPFPAAIRLDSSPLKYRTIQSPFRPAHSPRPPPDPGQSGKQRQTANQ